MTIVEQNPNPAENIPVDPNIRGLGLAATNGHVLPQHVSSTVQYRAQERGLKLSGYVDHAIWERVVTEAQQASETPDTLSGFKFHIQGLAARIRNAFQSKHDLSD